METSEEATTLFHRSIALLDHPRAFPYIVLSAALLRMSFVVLLANTPLQNDQKQYHDVAVQIVRNAAYSPDWPPGFPYVLAAFHLILGSAEVVSRLASLFLSLLCLMMIHKIARKLSTCRAANLILIAFSILPTFVFHSFEPLTQTPTALCLLGVILLCLEKQPLERTSAKLLLGFLLAAAVLIRPSSALFAAFIFVYILVRWKRPMMLLIPVATATFIIAAWEWKAHELTGDWVVINYYNNSNLFYGNNPYTPLYRTWWLGSHGAGEEGVPVAYSRLIASIDRLPAPARDIRFRQEALAHILERPDLFVFRTLSRMRAYFAFDTFAGSFIIQSYGLPKLAGLAVIGTDALLYLLVMLTGMLYLFLPGTDAYPKPLTILLLGTVLSYALPYWISFAHPSYHFPIVPVLGMFAAPVIEALIARRHGFLFQAASRKRRIVILPLVMLFFVIQIEWVLMMSSRI